MYGYPEITADMKAKIFGLTAAKHLPRRPDGDALQGQQQHVRADQARPRRRDRTSPLDGQDAARPSHRRGVLRPCARDAKQGRPGLRRACARPSVAAGASALLALGMSGAACSSVAGDRSEAGAADAADDGYGYPAPGDGATGDEPPFTYAPTFDAVWNEICSGRARRPSATRARATSSSSGTSPSLTSLSSTLPRRVLMCAHRASTVSSLSIPRAACCFPATNPPCGARMPVEYGYSGSAPLVLQIEQVRAWIACGALDGDGGCPGDASPDGPPDGSPE